MSNIYHTNHSWDLYHKHQPFYIHWSMNGWSFNPKDSYPTGNSKNHGIHWSLRKVSSLIKLARYRSPWREHTLFFCIPKSKSKRTTFFINTCMRKMSFLLKKHQDRVFLHACHDSDQKAIRKPEGSMCLRLSAIHQCLYIWFSSWHLWDTNTKETCEFLARWAHFASST